jgi:3',5'-nucleoside bisphosphate phosphatase
LKADLHCHTLYSDGKLSPHDVVKMARKNGVGMLAITDHETFAGLPEARQAGDKFGVEIVDGIEFAVRVGKVESHLLGLWVDTNNAEINEIVKSVKKERVVRAEKMVAKLIGLGMKIKMKDVLKNVGRGVIARPHIAQTLVNLNYAKGFDEAFKKFIGWDCPGYVARQKQKAEKIIDIIHNAGGVAVVAHGLVGGPQQEHVLALVDMGVDAIEVMHPKLSGKKQKWLSDLAAQSGLCVSGGTDYHGKGWSSGQIGDSYISVEQARLLQEVTKKYRD